MRRASSILNGFSMLAVIGILAGALGGLAMGIGTGRTASASSSSFSK